MNITIAPAEQNNPFALEQVKTDEQLNQELESDELLQKMLAEQQQGQLINFEMAQEIYSILQEMEGNYYDVSKNDRYLNWDSTAGVPYTVLRKVGGTEPARLIKNKRRFDLEQYGKIPRMGGVERGCRFRYRDPHKRPTKSEKAILRRWEQQIISNFFYVAQDPYPNLSKFLGTAYDDYFDLDDITMEIRRKYLGTPIGVHLSDPRM